MTHRSWVVLLIVTMFAAGLQASAQELVSSKLLPSAPALRTGIAARNLAFQTGNDASKPTPPPPHRHWSKTGKVLTIVGAGLLGAGAAAIAHGENTQVSCNNGTCVDIAWKATGAIWAGAGAALVIVGVTRHTTD